jgi:hypothetical protein
MSEMGGNMNNITLLDKYANYVFRKPTSKSTLLELKLFSLFCLCIGIIQLSIYFTDGTIMYLVLGLGWLFFSSSIFQKIVACIYINNFTTNMVNQNYYNPYISNY